MVDMSVAYKSDGVASSIITNSFKTNYTVTTLISYIAMRLAFKYDLAQMVREFNEKAEEINVTDRLQLIDFIGKEE